MTDPVGLRGSIPIDAADIAAAEARLGFALPPALAAFCLRENGGMPRRCWLIDTPRGIERQVDWFIPVMPAGRETGNGIVHAYRHYAGEQLIPPTAIPFATDAGGNPFLLDRIDGRVWFMPMDEWEQDETPAENQARSGQRIADDLPSFLAALTDAPPDWARD